MYQPNENITAGINQKLAALRDYYKQKRFLFSDQFMTSIEEDTDQETLETALRQWHQLYFQQMAAGKLMQPVLDFTFAMAEYIEQRFPETNTVSSLITKHMQAVAKFLTKKMPLNEKANTTDHKEQMQRLALELYTLLTADGRDRLAPDLQELARRLQANDPQAYVNFFVLLAQYDQQLEFLLPSQPEISVAAAYMTYLREFIIGAIVNKNYLHLPPADVADLQNKLAGPFFTGLTFPLLEAIAQSLPKSLAVINSVAQYFDTADDTTIFADAKIMNVSLLREKLQGMKNMQAVVSYLIDTSPKALRLCTDLDLTKALLQFHLHCIGYFTGLNGCGVYFTLAPAVLEQVLTATKQIARFSPPDDRKKINLASDALEQLIERAQEQQPDQDEPIAVVSPAQSSSSVVILQQLAEENFPAPIAEAMPSSVQTRQTLTAVRQQAAAIDSLPLLQRFSRQLNNNLTSHLLANKALHSNRIAANLTALPKAAEQLINIAFEASELAEQGHLLSAPVSLLTFSAKSIINHVRKMKVQEQAAHISEKLPSLFYIDELSEILSIQLTQILEKQLLMLTPEGIDKLAKVITERVLHYFDHVVEDPTRPRIEQIIETLLSADSKHSTGPGLSSVRTPADKRSKFLPHSAEALLSSAPLMVISGATVTYWGGPGFDLTLPPRRVTGSLATRLLAQAHMQRITAAEMQPNQRHWQAICRMQPDFQSTWLTTWFTAPMSGERLFLERHNVALLTVEMQTIATEVSSLKQRVGTVESRTDVLAEQVAVVQQRTDAQTQQLQLLIQTLHTQQAIQTQIIQQQQQQLQILQGQVAAQSDLPRGNPTRLATDAATQRLGLSPRVTKPSSRSSAMRSLTNTNLSPESTQLIRKCREQRVAIDENTVAVRDQLAMLGWDGIVGANGLSLLPPAASAASITTTAPALADRGIASNSRSGGS